MQVRQPTSEDAKIMTARRQRRRAQQGQRVDCSLLSE